jgi:hypothetical protein
LFFIDGVIDGMVIIPLPASGQVSSIRSELGVARQGPPEVP